jgi:uncharacterized protein (DUF305 family)
MFRYFPLAAMTLALLPGCTPSGETKQQTEPANASSSSMDSMAGMNMMTPAPGDSEATRGYKQAMMASMQQMPPYTGDPDRDFMQQMRTHHQGAIRMSEVLLKHGKDQQTRALAEEIIKAQRREIADIDAWLAAPR